jgi:tetratricopeptide (TPR) repeat protein
MDWRADGSCVINSVLSQGTSKDLKSAICYWNFQRISDDEFVINSAEDSGSLVKGPLQFRIMDSTRIHNEKYHYDALKIICPDQELERVQKDLAIRQQRADADRENTESQLDLGAGFEKLGDTLRAQGKSTDALGAYRKMLATIQQLADRSPANPDWQRDLAIGYEEMGYAFSDENNTTQALDAFQRSRRIREKLAEGNRGDPRSLTDLARTLINIGIISDAATAKSALTEAAGILDQLEREQRLAEEQQTWLKFVRERLAKLP